MSERKSTAPADKSGVFSLLGVRYQVGPKLARRRVQVRFDPEAMHQVEVWHRDAFAERVKPLRVLPCRRPRADSDIMPQQDREPSPKTNWLGHLFEQHRNETGCQPLHLPTSPRQQADQDILSLLATHLDPSAFDEHAARLWLDRYGPLDPNHASSVLRGILDQGMPRDQHVIFYLQHIKDTRP